MKTNIKTGIKTVWITTNALTTGIFEARVKEVEGDMVILAEARETTVFFKPNWHKTKKDAIKFAEDVRDERVEFFEEKIQNLKAIKF